MSAVSGYKQRLLPLRLLIEVARLNRAAERLCRTDYEHVRDKTQASPAEVGGDLRARRLEAGWSTIEPSRLRQAKILVIQKNLTAFESVKTFFLFLPPIEQVKQSHNGQNKNANDQPCCIHQQYGHRSSGSVKMVPGQGDTQVCYEVRLLCPSRSTSSARFVPNGRRRFENSGQLKRVKGP